MVWRGYTILYFAILYCPILSYTVLSYYTILYYTILYDTIRYDTIRYDTIQYYTIPSPPEGGAGGNSMYHDLVTGWVTTAPGRSPSPAPKAASEAIWEDQENLDANRQSQLDVKPFGNI